MSRTGFATACVLCLLLAGAVPSRGAGPIDQGGLLREFEPVLLFHPQEDWAPERAETFVARQHLDEVRRVSTKVPGAYAGAHQARRGPGRRPHRRRTRVRPPGSRRCDAARARRARAAAPGVGVVSRPLERRPTALARSRPTPVHEHRRGRRSRDAELERYVDPLLLAQRLELAAGDARLARRDVEDRVDDVWIELRAAVLDELGAGFCERHGGAI